MARARAPFTFSSFLVRWLVALALVMGAFNPLGYSYVAWVFGEGDATTETAAPPVVPQTRPTTPLPQAPGAAPDASDPGSGSLPLKIVVGLVLTIGFVIYLRATWRSIGPFGVALVVALLAGLVWLVIDLGVLDPDNPDTMTWVVLFGGATVMAIGVSWSHIRRRITGQVDSADIGN